MTWYVHQHPMTLTDEEVRKMAKERVGFKVHLGVYLLINAMLAVQWTIVTTDRTFDAYWPVWTHFGWGVGLAFHAFGVYGPRKASLEKEEARIRRKYGNDGKEREAGKAGEKREKAP